MGAQKNVNERINKCLLFICLIGSKQNYEHAGVFFLIYCLVSFVLNDEIITFLKEKFP